MHDDQKLKKTLTLKNELDQIFKILVHADKTRSIGKILWQISYPLQMDLSSRLNPDGQINRKPDG